MNRFRLLSVLLLVALAIGGGWLLTQSRGAAPEKVNVVLISIDTCRADRLSCYGYQRTTTPNIDAIAAEGVMFRNVISPAPNTLPAHCSMLTGTNPPYHGVHDNQNYRLPESNVTLAETLKEHGYTTGAFVSAFVLDSQFSLDQGFDTYDDNLTEGLSPGRKRNERRAEDANRAASLWLKKHAGDRFFLFMHYYEPHAPYTPPEPFASRFRNDLYAGEIAYVDHQIGELVNGLKRLKLYDQTLIMVTADHGEGLGQHGETWHSYFIYHSTAKVPLVVKLPGRRKSRTVDETVALIDIVPTVLSYLGIPVSSQVHGHDLSPYLSGKKRSMNERYIYSESLVPTKYGCAPLFGLETRELKYIQTSRPELYDLIDDPGETTNLVDTSPQLARAFRERLRGVIADQLRTQSDSASAVLDEDSVRRLESLGYVGGAVRETFEFGTRDEDPKDFLRIYERLLIATDLFHRRNYDGVKKVCDGILAIRADVRQAHEMLGRIIPLDELEERERHYSGLLKLFPASGEAHFGLGNVRVRQRRFDEAAAHFSEAVRLAVADEKKNDKLTSALGEIGRVSPHLFQARLHLADTFLSRRRPDEAIEKYYEALRLQPLAAAPEQFRLVKGNAYLRLGSLLHMKGRYAEAAETFQNALELMPDSVPARQLLEKARAAQAQATTP